MKNFLRAENGYALILTLVFMPIFVGIALLVIDMGRAQNAQQDHQAAADALALAGARELDGESDSIDRAKAAMTEVSNTVSFMTFGASANGQTLTYAEDSTSPFTVVFLKQIPEDDDDPIDLAFLQDPANYADDATEDALAKFVFVFARSESGLRTFFFAPSSGGRTNLPIAASAVATLRKSTCDLTPVFMCNPFIGDDDASSKEKLATAFANGDLHGRMVKLTTSVSGALPGPGNVGFLQTGTKPGGGAVEVAAALAGDLYPVCVADDSQVTTQTGEMTSVVRGFNTRFDIYDNGFGNDFKVNGLYYPANNVRKGWYEGPKKNGTPATVGCVAKPIDEDLVEYLPAPIFSDNADPGTDLPDGYEDIMRSGPWNFARPVRDETGTKTYPSYWMSLYNSYSALQLNDAVNNATAAAGADGIADEDTNYTNLLAKFGGREPSRYEVYQYEQTHNTSAAASTLALSLAALPSAGKETGIPQCRKTPPASAFDRRVMLVAIVDCATHATNGKKTVPVDMLAEVFLVNPLKGSSKAPGSNSLDFEFIDLTENSNGSIDKYLREDVVLVR